MRASQSVKRAPPLLSVHLTAYQSKPPFQSGGVVLEVRSSLKLGMLVVLIIAIAVLMGLPDQPSSDASQPGRDSLN